MSVKTCIVLDIVVGANMKASNPVILPTYKLESNTILLPGIIYKLSFTRFKAAILLSRFRVKNSIIINKLISEFELDEESVPRISSKAIDGINEFHSQMKKINKEHNYSQELDWLVLACIPNLSGSSDSTSLSDSTSTNMVTICRIVGIADDSSGIKITFQAWTRGQIVQTTCYHKKNLYESSIKVDWNTSYKMIGSALDSLSQKSAKLFELVDKFLLEYQKALTAKSSDLSGFKLLTLNPLANSLYLQLISSDFQKAYLSLKKLYLNLQSYTDSKAFLRLLDLTTAVLPVPSQQRLEMLKQLTPEDQVSKMSEIFDFLIEIFQTLSSSCSYVDEFFANATEIQRVSMVSNQLKSIRLLLDAMGANRKSKAKSQLERRSNFSNAVKNTNSSSYFSNGHNIDDDEEEDDLAQITKFVQNLKDITSISSDNKRMILKDYKRLKSTQQQNSDYQVIRNYLDIIIDIPWDRFTSKYKKDEDINIEEAIIQLNKDHYGMNHVKKRLIQYLSVLKLLNAHNFVTSKSSGDTNKVVKLSDDFTIGGSGAANELNEEKLSENKVNETEDHNSSKAPILLLGGPPGVGKTSLAKSIAKSLGRKFQRVSLGGIRDEAEIRGHRRTYVGAMPGVIIQSLRKARSINPVILLDEIDKVIGGADGSSKVNGDPAAALLEVLDPEQNSTFTDHYIGFPVDLSQVMFICTANDVHNLSRPLLDRLELIEVPAYDYKEKIIIAKSHLLPRQISRNGLDFENVKINDEVLKKVIIEYTRESGVRNLERKLGSICRNKAVEFSNFKTNKSQYQSVVSIEDLPRYLGVPHSAFRELNEPFNSNKFGVVNGLSYNSDGSGSVLVFESIGFNSGKSSLSMTGRLGEVLTESANIGLKFIRFILDRKYLTYSVTNSSLLDRFNHLEIHLHVPAGAISKDGPSAGITMALSFLSLVLEKPVGPKIAMTGELTLRGSVLPIGGVKEKLLGAHLAGMQKVVLPRDNRKDIIEEYCRSINDDSKLNDLLSDDNKKIFRMNQPETFIRNKLGIELVYAEEFWDVIKAVWGDDLLIKFEQARLESRL